MGVDCKELKAFSKKLEETLKGGAGSSKERLMQECAKEIAARLLRKVSKRTPVGASRRGHEGGTLRRGWTAEAAARKVGATYVIVVKNPTKYAIYVEYGHRTRGSKGWVNGRFMLRIAAEEVERMAPLLLEKRLNIWLREVFL